MSDCFVFLFECAACYTGQMDLMHILSFVLSFIFGTIIGSFLNVVIYRFGSGAGLRGRSKCLVCGKTLRAHMLIPVFSFLFQRGRCAYCGARISRQYPIVELLTGALFTLALSVNTLEFSAFTMHGVILFALDTIVWSTLLLVTVYDLKHKIIPDRLSLLFALVAGTSLVAKLAWGILPEQYLPIFDAVPKWIDIAAAPLIAAPFALLWFLSHGRAMGLGDAKLSWGIGWFLGFAGGISAVVLAFWIAFFPSLFLLLLRGKRFTMKSEIPFAPFLVLGTLVVYAFGVDLLSWTF